MGHFRQIRGLYLTAQLVLTEGDDHDPSHRLDLGRNHSWFSAAVGMADADDSFLKWSFASAICGLDDSRSRNQGTFGRFSLLSSRWSLPFGQLRRISIQHRSAATIFASTCVVVLCRTTKFRQRSHKKGRNPGFRPCESRIGCGGQI